MAPQRLESVIDCVRTMVLQWAMRLEEEGIVGDGMSFSSEEKQKAASSPSIRIDNFQGVLGDVYQSTVLQNLQMTVNKGDFDSLRKFLQSHGIEDEDIEELQKAIEADPQPKKRESFGARVGEWLGKMTAKAAQGIGQIPFGTAGSLLANAIWNYYGM